MSEERTTFGAVAQYICHENYTLIGNENRTCTLNGWSGKHPQCLVDWCPEPPQISGGKIKVSGRRAGSTVTYSCDYGYVLIGEDILSCGLGGEWTGKTPICRCKRIMKESKPLVIIFLLILLILVGYLQTLIVERQHDQIGDH